MLTAVQESEECINSINDLESRWNIEGLNYIIMVHMSRCGIRMNYECFSCVILLRAFRNGLLACKQLISSGKMDNEVRKTCVVRSDSAP